MSPFEHGEVFVLDDGGETDLDLGNYERFMDVCLRNESNLTTGKIYQVSSLVCVEQVGMRCNHKCLTFTCVLVLIADCH